jgi:hypothetical protein
LALDRISDRKREGFPWSHPGTTIVDREGLLARVGAPLLVRSVDLSVDGNDTYEVEVRGQAGVLWHTELGPVRNGGGLTVHRVPLEAPLAVHAGDEVRVRPLGGDGRYSVGHLKLEE